MSQSRAPLLEALAKYHLEERYGFTPPGHRQGRGVDDRTLSVIGRDAFGADVLVSGGLDDRRMSGQVLADAERLMASAVSAEQAFFSTCGSSLSVKAAMMAVAGGPGGELLVSRDAHKSIVAGLIFSGLQPRLVAPRWDTRLHLTHPPSPDDVRAAWEQHPDAAGMLIVSPTPYGTCADIAAVCHSFGKPLIVDEAWGAHLPFHDDLPTWAMDAGADLCVVSVHKMGAGFEQGSVFHTQGSLIDFSRLSDCADLLMTTSPSALIYAGLDCWRRQMVERGHQELGTALDLARRLRDRIDRIPGMHVMHDDLLHAQASHDLDELQVLIDVADLDVTGYQCADWLRGVHRIDVGLSDHRRVLATVSIADSSATVDRLADVLNELPSAAKAFDRSPHIEQPSPRDLQLPTRILPRDAFFGETEAVPVGEAAGRVAAEQITPYPPGIPVVIPGELLNDEVLDYLRSGLAAGMNLPDATDPRLDTVKVVR
ncbi:putative decarboxylase [Gordonia effusa NBRC 100432]|uniref:Putative decarboxylase n=1 Tax=Gordonia effusa NBRC 100432 TaxID=1077974 RepID=H0R5I0_9ACTN|nr:ornithine decarboxylase [Gordonia effusa]GAB20331.1 putative decarboxylase [Gordonia effusa NBRC 100432]